jgi:hypothetical protein
MRIEVRRPSIDSEIEQSQDGSTIRTGCFPTLLTELDDTARFVAWGFRVVWFKLP